MKKRIMRFNLCPYLIMVTLIMNIGILKAQEPDVPIQHESLKAFLDQSIDELVKQDKFSGTVLIAKDGEIEYQRAIGMSHKGYRIKNKMDTKFNTASMYKMLTGVAIAQLAQQGKLSFDDKVGKYLTDYPNEEVKEKVSIHQLLTHTSGTGLYWMEFFTNAQWANLKTVQDFDNLTNKKPLAFEPGEKFSYSNSGPLILGLIIEKISGMSYDEYVKKNITEPAGMENTDCYDMALPISNVALGYTKRNLMMQELKEWHNYLFVTPTKGGPAGGGFTTAIDLLNFDIALRNNKLLNKKYFDILTTGKVEARPGKQYAYLFEDEQLENERIIGHSGGSLGVNNTFQMFMKSGYTIIILSNYDDGMSLLYKKIKNYFI